jgi:hypothetical protein
MKSEDPTLCVSNGNNTGKQEFEHEVNEKKAVNKRSSIGESRRDFEEDGCGRMERQKRRSKQVWKKGPLRTPKKKKNLPRAFAFFFLENLIKHPTSMVNRHY